MNDLTPASATALALPTIGNLTVIFSQPEQVEDLIARIEAEARSHAPDLTTAKGRKAVASLAHTVARSKTALDSAGKSLTDDARKQIAAVDAERRKIRDRLDALKTEIRKPLDDWEAAEERRIEAHKSRLNSFDMGRVDTASPSDQIRTAIAEVEATTTGAEWDEFQPIAEARKASALAHYRDLLAAAEQREADAAELARLRAEAEERARKDAEEAAAKAEAERIATEKAEAERLAAEKAEADRIAAERAAKREAERRAQAERDRIEAAEIARKQAEADAARREKEVADRHARELADAKAREEAAAQRERDRLAAERKAEADARAKREADQAHRARIRNEIAEGLKTLEAGNWFSLADALMDGKVPHCEVRI